MMMWLTLITKYWRYGVAGVVVLALSYCVNQHSLAHYKRGKADGIASRQGEIDHAYATIRNMRRELEVAAAKHAEQLAKVSKDYQLLKAKQEQKEKVQYVEVQKIVEKPIYRNVCFDDRGLSELNRTIKGK